MEMSILEAERLRDRAIDYIKELERTVSTLRAAFTVMSALALILFFWVLALLSRS